MAFFPPSIHNIKSDGVVWVVSAGISPFICIRSSFKAFLPIQHLAPTMNNNDILRSLRYTFDFSDDEMIKLFGHGGKTVTRAEVSDWLKREDDPEFKGIYDKDLATFLNGLIIHRRGKKEDALPKAEKTLTNNIILRKLKIALDMKDEDMLQVLESADRHISRHELSAFFRKPTQSQYRPCKDQVLRNFLRGMQLKFRPE
jgi:uncharacterized protein YehS (DUF1456 family)